METRDGGNAEKQESSEAVCLGTSTQAQRTLFPHPSVQWSLQQPRASIAGGRPRRGRVGSGQAGMGTVCSLGWGPDPPTHRLPACSTSVLWAFSPSGGLPLTQAEP